MTKTKHLQLVGKERRSSFIRRIMEINRTTEMMEDRTTDTKEDRTARMTEDLTTGSIEDLTEEDKTEDLMLKKSGAMVVKDMVI